MTILKALFDRTNLLVIIIVLGCLAALGMTAFSSRKQAESFEERQQQKKQRLKSAELHVQNLTRGLIVARVEKNIEQDLIHVVLRNDYPKIVTAYKVAVGSGTIASECVSVEDTDDVLPLRPGEMREEIYPLQADVDTLGIKVLAVVFDDKTSDGAPQYVQEIQEYRLGLGIGINHAVELLDAILRLPETELPKALGALQVELSPHSGRDEKVLPHFVKVGIGDVGTRIARDLARTQNTLQGPQDTGSETGRRELTTLVNRLATARKKL